MALLPRIAHTWSAAAGLSLAVLGCTSLPKNPLASKPNESANTAESGSGELVSDQALKNPTRIQLAYGQWQEQLGQQAEARESYNKVLSAQPKNVDAMLGLARIDQAAGLMDDAETRLKRALKLAPKDARVLATYGNFYAAQQDWQKAIEKHQLAAKLAPEDPRYEFLLGVSMARSGEVEASYPHFARSVGDAQAHYNLGYILYEEGDRAGSLEHFEQALALKPDLTLAQTMIDKLNQRSDGAVLAKGTRNSLHATPASGIRTVPVISDGAADSRATPQSLPLRNQAPVSPAQPPAGLTPAQLEQWRNQQGQ